MNFGQYLPKRPKTPKIDRNDPKFFQNGIGTPWTKFLESPLCVWWAFSKELQKLLISGGYLIHSGTTFNFTSQHKRSFTVETNSQLGLPVWFQQEPFRRLGLPILGGGFSMFSDLSSHTHDHLRLEILVSLSLREWGVVFGF